jgi:23S rRNA A2030 N6-methylase RlmJ
MNRHFAELGDVWKHLPLAEILHMDPPRVYWETHAGSASYPLTESPSRLHGLFGSCPSLHTIQNCGAARTSRRLRMSRTCIRALR